MRKVSYDKKMVHSAYSHITVITLLAFAAINGVRGKPAHVIERLTNVENKTLEIITNLAGAEGRLQTIKERIFSQNPTSRGVIEKHLDCLETAYTYSWGGVVFNTLAQRLPHYREVNLADAVNCAKGESSAYQNLGELNLEIQAVFEQKALYMINTFLQNLYTTHITRG
uniref:Uncharacterized protein n=1 Tax=Trichobilharzia regenti TaxID=157069 RepID=A0AA85JC97_TRIRE|nr:unnamed protein product [Trichobilharzia regenti]CAH8820688.1 unnamed protein product [Trichobilharzia regenti]